MSAARLEASLGIPVLPVVGHRGLGLDAVRRRIGSPETWERPVVPPPQPVAERAGWVDSIAAAVLTQRPGRHRVTEAVDRTPLAARRLVFARALKRDDIVHVIPFNENCRVRSINRSKRRLAVVLGHNIIEVSFDDVTWIHPTP